jgi:Ca2+-binding EF-hand superfamily protein
MKLFLSGGVVLAALFAAAPAFSQVASQASLPSSTAHTRHSFFTSNQNRSDVAGHVMSMFTRLDLNHDGFITREEIATSQSQFDERASKSAPKRAAKMFERLDADHDGKVTRAEVNAARKSPSGKQPKDSRRSALLAEADADKDGIVTRAEFDSAAASGKLKMRHANMRGSAIVRLFDLADTNKDGRVSMEEAQRAALQQFDAADLNHDGVLTPVERRMAAKAERAKKRAA